MKDKDKESTSKMARILLVDDESKIRVITKVMLEKAGHEVVEAESGADGLKILETDRPDLILLDIMMPGMEGWEVCERIKTNNKLRDIPVVMFTVRTSEEDHEMGAECGADDHIDKPFTMGELLETVEKHLDMKTRQAN